MSHPGLSACQKPLFLFTAHYLPVSRPDNWNSWYPSGTLVQFCLALRLALLSVLISSIWVVAFVFQPALLLWPTYPAGLVADSTSPKMLLQSSHCRLVKLCLPLLFTKFDTNTSGWQQRPWRHYLNCVSSLASFQVQSTSMSKCWVLPRIHCYNNKQKQPDCMVCTFCMAPAARSPGFNFLPMFSQTVLFSVQVWERYQSKLVAKCCEVILSKNRQTLLCNILHKLKLSAEVCLHYKERSCYPPFQNAGAQVLPVEHKPCPFHNSLSNMQPLHSMKRLCVITIYSLLLTIFLYTVCNRN